MLQTLCVGVVGLLANVVVAEDLSLDEQRRLFSRGEQIAHLPKSWEYQHILEQLGDYPLTPYIELKTLMAYPYLSNRKKIEAFLDAYEGTPMDEPLRRKWLSYLARQEQGALFLHYYRDVGSTELYCSKLKYELDKPQTREQALAAIDELWLVGRSQPQECDPLFKAWTQAGKRTADMVWRRLALAGDGGNHTLIPYLKKLLPADERYLADLWLKIRRAPSYVSRTSLFPGTFPEKEAEIIAYGLSRLIWHDRDLALRSYHKLARRFTFNDTQAERIANRFAIGLSTINHPEVGEWLEKANKLKPDEELFRWHLTHLLREQDWQKVLEIIDAAPEAISSDFSYQYWQARSFENIRVPDLATQGFHKLSNRRHYYGFMASGKLKQPASLDDQPLIFSEADLSATEQLPAMQRAREFLALKRYASARREWWALQDNLDKQQRLMTAVVADNWGWHDRVIFTLARNDYLDDVKRRFPLAYGDQLVKYAKQHNVDPAWAFAIARRESSFMADANSSAGARGLMQLLPSTVNYISKRKVSARKLFEPELNVQYGTQYLRYLMDRVNENPVLATASYNAGWRRVRQWLPKDEAMPLDVWIETIPFKETRDYVKAVLAYRQIYRQQLGESDNLFQEFASASLSRADFSF